MLDLRMRTKLSLVVRRAAVDAMLCCGRKKGREATPDLATSPRRQAQGQGTNGSTRPKEPPPMVVQGDFRKVSGISNEIFRQIETVENDHDATTAAALEAVERRGEMVVRLLDPRHLGRAAADVDKRYLALQDSKYAVHIVEIVKRPGQTLGLYIREGNGMDRSDGVFISRIALESAVYNSGCLKVGDEILAVNLVDVTRMSLDDVVIIMSIPRRLVLVTRQPRGVLSAAQQQSRTLEPKPPPVVVIKKELTRDDEPDDDDDENGLSDRRYNISHGRHTDSLRRDMTGSRRTHRDERDMVGGGRERMQTSRSHLALGVTSLRSSQQSLNMQDNSELNNYMLGGGDLYYNSRPHQPQHTAMSLDRRTSHGSNTWSYQPPPPPVITEQPKAQHFQPYDKAYPKTLESLAEKVHSFYPNSSTTPVRRMSATSSTTRLSSLQSQYYARPNQRVITRSGSDQHLPRVEYDYGSPATTHRQGTHSLLRSSLKPGTISSYYTDRSTHGSSHSSRQPMSVSGTLGRRQRSLDYASDTEATCSSYYYYRDRPSATGSRNTGVSTLSHMSSATPNSITNPVATPRGISLRSNSLPRDSRGSRSHHQIPSLAQHTVSSRQSSGVRFERDSRSLLDQDDSDGALSAPELPIARRKERADEYRAWLSRAPSTSAIYERIRARDNITSASVLRQKGQRFTFSAENLPERTRQSELLYSSYRPGQLATMGPITPTGTSTLDRHTLSQRSTSLRRMRHLLELEAKHLGERKAQDDRARVLEINPAEFLKYKMDKPAGVLNSEVAGVSGLLWIHLLAGRGLRSSVTSSSGGMRDLYCVLECDRVHKARTVVRTGDLVFDWDETFELDLVSNRELDLLIYSWDPQYRHKLCYKGSVHLATLLRDSPIHQLALKIEPRGTLYLRLRHTDPHHTFLRRSKQLLLPSRSGVSKSLVSGIFGTELETVVNRENLTGGVPGGVATSVTLATGTNTLVPIIVRRCVEEIERRGLDIIGLYRLCGSATKKRILREAFERNARTVDLSPDNVPDINVITGVLKDYLRELPEPLFTKCLYQMMIDALSVCLPDDPEGNAKLMFSILDCLPRINRATLIYLMDHLALVVSQSEHNKMSPQNLAACFGPVFMLQSEGPDKPLDFNQPINALRYLLEIWPVKSGSPRAIDRASPLPLPPPLPVKPPGFSPLKGGVVPTPSKGIRKPPPAVPARCTPVVVASPTSESSPDDTEEPTSDGSVKRTPPPRVYQPQHNGQNGVSTPPAVPSRNHNRQIFSNSNNFPHNLSVEKSPQSPGMGGAYDSDKSSPKVSPGFVNGKNNFQEEIPEGSTAETEELSVETPSSSTGTEEDSRKEVGERGVEADEEASDDEVENDVMSQK
ncbi:rho GTPase-activating protein 100F-like [Macrosteles quadrilineatus]|uniref:rho GTPase-activating protein 100F-like n=1 Tax=Macrosteles quadrilineatus TaxID=74068 RepID=UPI0023E1C9E4|nr:rho GTPase-activating protein 100F-like [Macrosteles quadrilineatus]